MRWQRLILYSLAKTNNPEDSFQDISTPIFARAVDQCAWHMEEKLGRGRGRPDPCSAHIQARRASRSYAPMDAFTALTLLGYQITDMALFTTMACEASGY